MPICPRCKTEKDTGCFSKDRTHKNGLTSYCKPCSSEYDKEQYRKHSTYRKSTMRAYRAMVRKETLAAYGGPVCACCGEDEEVFLCIDHINGGGGKQLKAINKKTGAAGFYSWLRQNGYPPGYQVLCFNCNMAKHIRGTCPHQRSI